MLYYRWARLREMVHEIDQHVTALVRDEDVAYRSHIGGANYISVSTGIFCVDFRRYFKPSGEVDVKPTRRGVALHLKEWWQLQAMMQLIDASCPELADAVFCATNPDHIPSACRECSPYGQ